MSSCVESFGDTVESGIASFFSKVGTFVGFQPRKTLALAILLTIACGAGFLRWETENRPEKLWVPQDTTAEKETIKYESYFASESRFNSIIVSSSSSSSPNVLSKETLLDAMQMHNQIETKAVTVDGIDYNFLDRCTKSGGSCATPSFEGICTCLVNSILRQWNYNLTTLENDNNVLETVNQFGTKEDLESTLGNPTFDENGNVVAAEAFTISYFLQDQSEVVAGNDVDPINEQWEEEVFLGTAQSVPTTFETITVNYFAARSFGDEFGDEISGDLGLVQVSYVIIFIFLGATLGKIKCGNGSRWTMSLAALATVGLSTAAGFGLSSAFGLFFGPVHSLLPFILLGIGVDDAFVIVNAFDRERNVKRMSESNDQIGKRCARALARAGASITVTSLTDLVAFAISSSSALPALASFCAYAAISIFLLWVFASTFFTATLTIDERRQRDNRRECLCCLTRKKPFEESEGSEGKGEGFQEGYISKYFRNYHAPAILSKVGKTVVLIVFAGLLGFGIYGTMNLDVEDTERSFIPSDSYLQDYFDAADEYSPSEGSDLFITFEGISDIYENRQQLAELDSRLSGLSTVAPYISEPVSENAYRNVMTGLYSYLTTFGTADIGNVAVGDDNWPTNEEDFFTTLTSYASFNGPGAVYAQDIAVSEDETGVEAIRVQLEYVRLTKRSRGEIIDDSDRQIEAMDATRAMIADWDDLPPAFPYSSKFISIEGFKIIKRELFLNVGLAISAVGVIVFVTVASPITALVITLTVAACIVEILGFMYALGIAIDSVSVINIVLAVGLSVDYSAHVGHCFMVKGGNDKDKRALEALADIGAAVLNGAISTFLAVIVLLFSTSYVFVTLSRQFALTVALGITHGLILLPVLLSLFGPKPFTSAHDSGTEDVLKHTEHQEGSDDEAKREPKKKEAVVFDEEE